MKDIYTIYEGLLKGQDSHMSMTDDDVKAMMTLGTHMKLHYVQNCTENSAGMFSAQSLKVATKNLPYIDKNIEIINRGNSGDRISDLYGRWKEDTAKHFRRMLSAIIMLMKKTGL